MPASRRRLAVRFDDAVWREAVRGFSDATVQIAVSARAQMHRNGLALADTIACSAEGSDATALAGCVKVYLPLKSGPASERPFAFVLQLTRDREGELTWVFAAFGPRHPGPRVRSVYERAHRQLHGHFAPHAE